MSNASNMCPSRVTRMNQISKEVYPELLVEDLTARMEDIKDDAYSCVNNNKEVNDGLVDDLLLVDNLLKTVKSKLFINVRCNQIKSFIII